MIERIYDLTGRIHGEAQLGISEAETSQLRALLLSDTVESYGSYGWRTIRRAGLEARPRVAGRASSRGSRIHVFPRGEDVDGRDKYGNDGECGSTPAEWDTNLAVTGDNASPARRIPHD